LCEVTIDPAKNTIHVNRVCQTFECGAITSPANLLQQVQGAIVMGLGPALREGMEFDGGKILNASFWRYEVPRLADLPALDINLMNRPDLPSAGAGETPLIAVAPAIANAVFHATNQRIRQMPMKLAPTATVRT
jgi:isoquinoline 1-oxidoreductase